MLNRKSAPLGVLAVGLMAVLATIGIVNGLWSKNLVIEGEVRTGDLNTDWLAAVCSEWNGWPRDAQTAPGEYLGKDVGWFLPPEGLDTQELTISLRNTYPSYLVHCGIELRNNGTIPFNITGWTIEDLAGNLTGCEPVDTLDFQEWACDQLTVQFIDGTGAQLDPGRIKEWSLWIHTEQLADQSTCGPASGEETTGPFQIDRDSVNCNPSVDYDFRIKVCVSQWNEGASFAECVDSAQHEGPPSGPGDNDGIPYWQDTEGPSPNTNGLASADDCSDGIDNDGDGLVDVADPGCI